MQKRYIETMEKQNSLGRQLESKVSAFMEEFHMLQAGDKVLVGLSGGADSVCLFYVLLSLLGGIGCAVEAVHVNHGLRESATRDEVFVRELCAKEGVPLYVRFADVGVLAKENGMSLEEAGRKARYEIFDQVANQTGAARIATAHHANDQAETILFHLCRGSGLRGIAGIYPVRGRLIRPLLTTGRDEIEAYLAQRGLCYMTDETNADTAFSRNRIRHDILPALSKEICSTSTEHIAATGETVREALSYLDRQIREAFLMCTGYREETKKQCLVLHLPAFEKLHPYIQKEVLLCCMYEMTGSKKDISRVHVEALLNLIALQTGSMRQLAHGLTVIKSYDTLLFYGAKDAPEPYGSVEAAESGNVLLVAGKEELLSGVSCLLADGRKVVLRVFEYEKNVEVPRKAYTKWLDYDKIETPLTIRTPREGDFFYFDDKNRKSVKAYMVNEKIPAQERKQQLVVAEGNHVLYFLGRRISNYYKVSGQTKTILEITVTGG